MSRLLLPFVALAAGFVSFASPCCLPLVPGYLAYVSGVPGSTNSEPGRRRATVAALGFVAGFTLVFTILGVTAGTFGQLLLEHRAAVDRTAGIIIIVMALSTLGVLRIPAFNRERRFSLAKVPQGPRWSVPLGMAFAAGWTPCIGPVLAGILATAASSHTAASGAALLTFYGLGLGIPFIALAFGFDRAHRSFGWLRRHVRAVERFGGTLLLITGTLYLTGVWTELFRPLQRWFAARGWPAL